MLLSKFAAGALLVASALMPFSAGADSFGGKITTIQACRTPPGLLLTVGPPKGGEFLLAPSSIIFMCGVFKPGTYVLGNASGAVTCQGSSKLLGGFGIGNILGSVAQGALGGYLGVLCGAGGAGSAGLSALGTFSSFISGGLPFLGLSPLGSLGPLGISNILSFFGISFPHKLANLGVAHTITIIGTAPGP
jgi:hypothetical protein